MQFMRVCQGATFLEHKKNVGNSTSSQIHMLKNMEMTQWTLGHLQNSETMTCTSQVSSTDIIWQRTAVASHKLYAGKEARINSVMAKFG